MGVAAEQDTNERTAVERRDPLLGAVFDGRFRVDAKLAAGGFGAIYRATHLKSGHEFALKVLHANLTHDPRVVARFRREGEALTRLRDPHTITAYELGEAPGGTLYIVMELLHGETLYERIRAGGPLAWRRAMVIARAVCSSLSEAHAHGIIHRDLKPTNIHLERRGNYLDFVKVLDFGIAKLLQDSDIDRSELTQAGQMIGTLDYMSPEQMVGGQCTATSDVYTLGIVMYEMIAGRKPFDDANSAAAALAAVLTTTPPRLSDQVPVPPHVEQLVMRCLERQQSERYQTAAELAEALDDVLSHDDDLAINVAPRRADDLPTQPVSAAFVIESIPDPQRAPTVPLRARGFARSAGSSTPEPLAAALQAAAAAHSSAVQLAARRDEIVATRAAARDLDDIASHTASVTAPRISSIGVRPPRVTYSEPSLTPATYPRPSTQPPTTPFDGVVGVRSSGPPNPPPPPRTSPPRLVPRTESAGTASHASPSAAGGAQLGPRVEPTVVSSAPRPPMVAASRPSQAPAIPMFAEATPGQLTPTGANDVLTSALSASRLAAPRPRGNNTTTPLSGTPMKSLREAYPMIHQPPPSAMRPPIPAFDELPTALVGSTPHLELSPPERREREPESDPTTRRLMIGIAIAIGLIIALIANWLVTAM